MSERLPYEEQLRRQWDDLPLPDADMAWADMKRRLEEDDDDRVLIPWWRRGCAVWILLLLILFGLGWWYRHSQQELSENNSATTARSSSRPATGLHTGTVKNDTVMLLRTGSEKHPAAGTAFSHRTGSTEQPGLTGKEGKLASNTAGIGNPVMKLTQAAQSKTSVKGVQASAGSGQVTGDKPGISSPSFVPAVDTLRHTGKAITPEKPRTDSSGIVKTDTVVKKVNKPRTPDTGAKKDSTAPVINFFSAGIAVHQQLPVAGQQFTPYNAFGRKGTLADYIPAVYFRFHHGDRWFLQTGVRYGAPQYNKEFTYELKKNTIIFRDTSSILKKTFYHQLPVSFHYRLLPGLTVGAGVVWNRFSSAVVQQIVVKPARATPIDTLVSDEIIRIKKPTSQFSRSYFQAMTELQYQWRRFSLGATYSFGLQPYIRFTLPGGMPQEQRNQSLQVFLRYELWRSKDR